MTDKWTIKRLIDWTTDYFAKNNLENPHLEAEILLSHALKTERIRLYIDFEKEIGEKEREIFKGYIRRRIKREPTAYITGYQPFMSLNFKVDHNVLIPRPETELLVEESLKIINVAAGKVKVLDIGTGCGAIAVSIAKFSDNAEVYATDASAKALEIAADNSKLHKVDNKIVFTETDLFPQDSVRYNMLLSNPPYILTDKIKDLQAEISGFEPKAALDGGKDGLDFYRRIIEKAGTYLIENGSLLFEVGAGQAKEVIRLSESHLKPKDIRIKKDLSGIERIVIIKI